MWFAKLVDGIDTLARMYMRLSGTLRPHRTGTTYFGARMHCDIRDFIQRRIYYFGIFEPNLSHYLTERLRRGDRFVDVGANVGYVSLLAARLVGSGQVISIEAAPNTFRKLCANLRLNAVDNVTAVNVAATGEPCLIGIVDGSDRNIGNGRVRPVTEADQGSETVRGVPLSILIEEPEQVAAIKIDVEGSEGAVLDDILTHLDRFACLHTIAVEMVPSSARYLDLFAKAGFRCFALPNNYRIGATLVRAYLDRSGEGGFVVKRPIETYSDTFTDYVLERDVQAARTAPDTGRLRLVPPSAA